MMASEDSESRHPAPSPSSISANEESLSPPAPTSGHRHKLLPWVSRRAWLHGVFLLIALGLGSVLVRLALDSPLPGQAPEAPQRHRAKTEKAPSPALSVPASPAPASPAPASPAPALPETAARRPQPLLVAARARACLRTLSRTQAKFELIREDSTVPGPAPGASWSQPLTALSHRAPAVYQDHRPARSPCPEGFGADTIRLWASTAALSAPMEASCDLIRRWMALESQVLQPLAQRQFGQPIARIEHDSPRICSVAPPLSSASLEHDRVPDDLASLLRSLSRADSIAAVPSPPVEHSVLLLRALVLEDGTRISVRRDWRNRSRKGAFLRESAHRGCGLFLGVHTPETTAAFRSHIGFSLYPGGSCKN